MVSSFLYWLFRTYLISPDDGVIDLFVTAKTRQIGHKYCLFKFGRSTYTMDRTASIHLPNTDTSLETKQSLGRETKSCWGQVLSQRRGWVVLDPKRRNVRDKGKKWHKKMPKLHLDDDKGSYLRQGARTKKRRRDELIMEKGWKAGCFQGIWMVRRKVGEGQRKAEKRKDAGVL